MASFPISVRDRVEGWMHDYCRLWAVPGLAAEVTLEFSNRMSRTLGKAIPARRAVRLATFMLDESEGLLREVVCHEIAHLAAEEIHGPNLRPHGPEWRALMRQAGFQPRARLPAGVARQVPYRRGSPRAVWAHACPQCRWVRLAGRPMREWRCASCYGSGRSGLLSVRKVVR